jgi:alkylation response protein AidB-like acyl-CoA dehydrogenase
MKLAPDPEVERFRADFSAFLDAHLPAREEAMVRSKSSADIPDWARRWQRKLFDEGWLLPAQPPEYGGRNATLPQVVAHLEELSRRRIYHSFNPQGLNIIAASLLTFGTEEQKRDWAIPLLRAEITASLGMSEPGAGSDLAGLRTRAVLEGDHFVVNGQKVWTSGAHDADVLLTFVRTDPEAPKHKGISVLLIPTDSEGLVRRPFGSIAAPDDLDFNEVFFTDVHVPKENLVGPLNEGWRVANGSLGHERTLLWVHYAERMDALINDAACDEEWYATLQMDVQALRLLGYRLLGSEAAQNAELHALEQHGAESLLHPVETGPYTHMNLETFNASWFERYARSFGGTIAGGTSEIQRNIIAERILGLPR